MRALALFERAAEIWLSLLNCLPVASVCECGVCVIRALRMTKTEIAKFPEILDAIGFVSSYISDAERHLSVRSVLVRVRLLARTKITFIKQACEYVMCVFETS